MTAAINTHSIEYMNSKTFLEGYRSRIEGLPFDYKDHLDSEIVKVAYERGRHFAAIHNKDINIFEIEDLSVYLKSLMDGSIR